MKKYSICNKTKELTEFHKDKYTNDGRKNTCKKCIKEKRDKKNKKKSFEIFETPFETCLCYNEDTSYLVPSKYDLKEIEKIIYVLEHTHFYIKSYPGTSDTLLWVDYDKKITITRNNKTFRGDDIYKELINIYDLLENGLTQINIYNSYERKQSK